MDLLFKRYASPFVLIDSLLLNNSLKNYINDLLNTVNEEKLWDVFIHNPFLEKTWGEFLEEHKPKPIKKVNLGATVIKSKNMLQNFNPQKEG